MITSRRFITSALITIACGILAAGCDDLVSDPNFHTWCGDQLCSWKLESGHIQRAPTWHPKDFGVELLDSTEGSHVTAISQVVDRKVACLEFSTLADVAVEAQVSIAIDFNNDGTIDYEQPVASTNFHEQKTLVTAPLDYDTLRFIIEKKGTGHAVLAQMAVTSVKTCTAPPIVLRAQPLGITCHDADVCSSGVCCEGRCAECCAAAGQAVACTGGGTCERRANKSAATGMQVIPNQCDPGKKKHLAGSECLLGDDCTSGTCDGALWKVFDGKLEPCTEPFPYSSACFIASVHAGRCK